jgi:hypothetical protein
MIRHLLALFAVLMALPICLVAGDTRALTAKDGRSIEVEILGYKGETLRVRRADTSRELQIPISSLA